MGIYYQDFQYLIVSINFFHEVAMLMLSFIRDKLQSWKKKFSIFLMERPYYNLKLILML